MKKSRYFYVPWYFFATLGAVVVFAIIGIFLIYSRTADKVYLGASFVDTETDANLISIPKSRKLEFKELPLFVISDDEKEIIAKTELTAVLTTISFGIKKEIIPEKEFVSEQDLANAQESMTAEMIVLNTETGTNADYFLGFLEGSTTIHFAQPTVPVGEKAAKFDFGIKGNMTIVKIYWNHLYAFLEESYFLSQDELQTSGFRIASFVARQKDQKLFGDLILTSSSAEESEVLTPE